MCIPIGFTHGVGAGRTTVAPCHSYVLNKVKAQSPIAKEGAALLPPALTLTLEHAFFKVMVRERTRCQINTYKKLTAE